MILTVDLASKFSAVAVRERGCEVHHQFDSAGKSSFKFCAEVGRAAIDYEVELVIIEDVPYGISSQAMTKPVTRLQGVLMACLNKNLDKTFFLNPSTWQKRFPGVGVAPRGLTKTQKDAFRIEAARAHAARLGYTPPDLVAEYIASLTEGTKVLKKNTNPLEKSMTDYIDAFLMTDWVFSFDTLEEVRGLVGVQQANI